MSNKSTARFGKYKPVPTEMYGMKMTIEKTDTGKWWLADLPFADTYGVGKSREKAIQDLRETLWELWEGLVESGMDGLGPHLQKLYKRLKKKMPNKRGCP